MCNLQTETPLRKETRRAVKHWLRIQAGRIRPPRKLHSCCRALVSEYSGPQLYHALAVHMGTMAHLAVVYGTTEQEMCQELKIYGPHRRRQ